MKKTICIFAVLTILFMSSACLASGWVTVTATPDVYQTPVPEGEYISANILPALPARANQKLSLRSGPGTKYTGLGTYPASTEIVIYDRQIGGTAEWGQIELRVDGGLCRAYTGMKRINTGADVPWANITATDAITSMNIVPRRGPGEKYKLCKKEIPAGTEVKVYHEENGFAMIDFKYNGDDALTRAWIPIIALANYVSTDSTVFVTYTPRPTAVPTPSPIPKKGYDSFDLAGNTTSFVDERGNLWSMGNNERGQIGVGSNNKVVSSPRQVMQNVASVSMGFYHSMALDRNGDVYTWGYNKNGQLGIGKGTQKVTTPTKVKIGDVMAIAAGDEHCVALTNEGELYTWGCNARGQLGNGKTANVNAPKQIKTPGTVDKIAAADYNTALILEDGSLWICGDNTAGQLCMPASKKAVTEFVRIPIENVADVALGDYHVAALTDNGDLYIWGRNDYGQLGNWKDEMNPEPVLILSDVRKVVAGDYHTIALTTNGELYAWGRNDNSQLGNGSDDHIYSPEKVASDIWDVDTGYAHTIIVKQDGSIWGVGRCEYGSLGLSETDNTSRWIEIMPMH